MEYQDKFKAIPGTTGYYRDPLSLIISTPNARTIRRLLTLKNTSVAWQLNKARQSLKKASSKRDQLDIMEVAPECATYVKLKARINGLSETIKELEPQLTEYLYRDNPDGTITVPPGMWYLCDSIKGNEHLNTKLKPYYIDGLRDYQIEGLGELYRYNRATLVLATGLGKGRCIASICIAAAKAGLRSIVVVPTDYLVGQTLEVINHYHDSVTGAGGGRYPELGKDILVTTAQSALQYIASYDVVLSDEAHHLPCNTWTELMSSAEKATHFYNFTGTAMRADGLGAMIHSFAGPVVFERDARWGIANGWLNPLRCFQVRFARKNRRDKTAYRLPDGVMATRAYHTLVERSEILGFIKGKAELAVQRGRRVLVVFRYIPTGLLFKRFCEQAGFPVEVGCAYSGSRLSKLPLQKFKKGDLKVLIGTDKLLSEGIDIGDISLLIMVTNHSSDVTTSQMVGRILRPQAGKPASICIDVSAAGYSQFERSADCRLERFRTITDQIDIEEREIVI